MTRPVGVAGLCLDPGLGLATLIVVGWLVSLIGLLVLDLRHLPLWILVIAVLVRTYLHTGLFIIGHDAMHGLLLPHRRFGNHLLGAVVLVLYAFLPYRSCLENHQRHHLFPASTHDPDFPSADQSGPLRWYFTFMAGYLSAGQMLGLLSGWGVLTFLLQFITDTAWVNVMVFCTLPLLLSSLQLFVFGTYLPHRRQRVPLRCDHPDSLSLPCWLSLLACFHFGYHREHHDHPGLAWFQLPAARRRALSATGS